MATQYYAGGAPTIAQLNTFTFAGTWLSTETITVTVGYKAWTFTTGSSTIATFLASFQTAFSALSSTVYPEFAEFTMANPTGTTITLTSNTAGTPFTATISTNSAAGTINGATSSTGTATTASSGPYDWSVAANWVSGSLPATGDTVVLDRNGTQIFFGLDQHTVTLAELRILLPQGSQNAIGLPIVNASSQGGGYPEYRPTKLKIGTTLCMINSQAGRINIDFGTVQTVCNVEATGSSLDQITPALLLAGTHTANVLNMVGGQAGAAFYAGDSFTAATVTMGMAGGGSGVQIVCGAGATLTTVIKNSGSLVLYNCAGLTLTDYSGTTVLWGVGSPTQLNIRGGRVVYNTSGVLGGTTVISGPGSLDFSQDVQAKTITNKVKIYGNQASFNDPGQVVQMPYVLDFIEGSGGSVVVGPNRTLTISPAT